MKAQVNTEDKELVKELESAGIEVVPLNELMPHPCDGCGEDVPTNCQEDGRDLCDDCAAWAEERAIKRRSDET